MKRGTDMMRSGLWQLTNSVSYFLIQLIFIGVLSRYLTKSEWGLVAITNAINQFALILTESGLGYTLIYRREVTKAHLHATTFFNIAIATFFTLLFYFTSGLFASFYNDPNLDLLIKVNSLNFFVRAFGLTSLFMLQKKMRFKELCITEVSANFISSAFAIYWAIMGWGVWAYIWSYIMMAILNAMGYIYFNRDSVSFIGKFKKQDVTDLFSYGFGQTLNRLVHGFLNNNAGVNFLVAKIMPMSIVGIFDRTYRIVLLPVKYLGNVIDRVMFAGTAKFNDDKELMYSTFERTLKLANTVAFSIVLILIIYSKEIVLILFGSKWGDAVLPLRILFIAIPFGVSQRVSVSILRSEGLVYKSAGVGLINFVCLFLLILLGSYWGFLGICVATTFGSLIAYFNLLYLVNVTYKKGAQLYFKPFIGALPLMLVIAAIIIPSYYFSSALNIFHNHKLEAFVPMIISLIVFLILASIIIRMRPRLLDDDVLRFMKKMPVINKVMIPAYIRNQKLNNKNATEDIP